MACSYPRHVPLLLPGLLLASALSTLLAGCGGDDDPEDRQMTVQFAAQVNGKEFACGKTWSGVGVGQPGTYRITDWRFFVHEVELVRPDGRRQALALNQDGIWQYQNVALLDLRRDCGNGALPSHGAVVGHVARADYSGICFKVGVPYALNHTNDASVPAPLNNSGMLWSWRSGRKFIRIDGMGDPDGLKQAFHVHLGSTQCPGPDPNGPPTAACGAPNIAEFCLDNFNAERDRVVMDIGTALAESNVVVNTPETAAGCMSGNADPECIAILPRLNLDFTYVAGAGAAPEKHPKVAPQRLFSVQKP